MIEYTVMDYEGEPVTIEDGEIYEADPPTSNSQWNSDDCEWEDPDELESTFGSESLSQLEYRCYYYDKL